MKTIYIPLTLAMFGCTEYGLDKVKIDSQPPLESTEEASSEEENTSFYFEELNCPS